ncbi:MAG: hypothetical protein GY953_25045, partial [bacterium]|nr:hypothetical protein [bacterium]
MPTKDLAYAIRTLSRSPSFTAVAALTIALGIGASTAIFSVANAVLLKPLPYREPGRLVVARGLLFSHADFLDLRDGAAAAFDDMAAVMTYRVIVPRGDGRPERIYKAQVTANFFRLMGSRVALGRDFTDADSRPSAGGKGPGLPVGRVAVLSHEYWQWRYGGDAAVIGQEMLAFPQRGPRIVGVLDPGFELLFPPGATIERKPDVWIAND